MKRNRRPASAAAIIGENTAFGAGEGFGVAATAVTETPFDAIANIAAIAPANETSGFVR
jgi:hypothetical protein